MALTSEFQTILRPTAMRTSWFGAFAATCDVILYESDDVKFFGNLKPHAWALSDLVHFRLRAMGVSARKL